MLLIQTLEKILTLGVSYHKRSLNVLDYPFAAKEPLDNFDCKMIVKKFCFAKNLIERKGLPRITAICWKLGKKFKNAFVTNATKLLSENNGWYPQHELTNFLRSLCDNEVDS